MRKESPGEHYTQTSRGISVLAECTSGFVQRQAKAGRVPHVVASNGTYLYPLSVVPLVKQLKAEGQARRGGAYGRAAQRAAAPVVAAG